MERRDGSQPQPPLAPTAIPSEDQALANEGERQARIDAGYQKLIRDLFGEPEMVLTPDQLSSAKVILNAGMDRYFDPVDKKVIISRYGLEGQAPLTLSQTGAEINRSRERARQRQERGLRRLRRPVRGFRQLRAVVGIPEQSYY